MSDMLARGVEWMHKRRAAYMTRTVTYRRGRGSTAAEAEVLATIGQTVFRLTTESGAELRVVMRDYLIEAALLSDFGDPELGDQVDEADDELTRTYEVMSPGGGEPEWRWSDRAGGQLRIHTKEVG